MATKSSPRKNPATLRCNRRELIAFYDERPDQQDPLEEDITSPISAITGLIGEDLVLGALRHYFLHTERQNIDLVLRCKQPGRAGFRLDGWVVTSSITYQTEVKNWCASAFGGKSVDEGSIGDVARYNLQRYLGGGANPRSVWKVLAEMDTSSLPDRPIQPLLAFWSPVAASGSRSAQNLPPFFECELKSYRETIDGTQITTRFEKISVFSASLYLRSLTEDFVELAMPRAARRLRKIEKLLGGWNG